MSDYVELINIMRDGGLQICDQAIGKWVNPDYYGSNFDGVRPEMIRDWQDKRRAIQALAIELKKADDNGR